MLLRFKKGFNQTTKILKKKNPVAQKRFYAETKDELELDNVKFGDTSSLDITAVMKKGLVQDKSVKKEHAFTMFIEDKDAPEEECPLEKSLEEDPETFAYKTKYPDETFEEWTNKYEDVYMNSTPPTQTFIDDCIEITGFPREEVEKKQGLNMPDFAVYDTNGKFKKMNWDGVKAEWKLDPRANAMIDQIDASYNLLEHRIENYDDKIASLKLVDWQQRERELGEEKVLELRLKFRDRLRLSQKPKNGTAIMSKINQCLDPLMDKSKDEMIDSFPEFKKIAASIKSLDRQLEVDEDGLPVWDYLSNQFLDTFYPEIRDELLVEVDHFDVDMEYKEQFKQLSHTNVDDLTTLLHDDYWFGYVGDQVSNEFFEKYTDSSDSKRNIAVAKAGQELNAKIKSNAELAQTVSKLKSSMDVSEEEGGEGETKTETHDTAKANEILRSIGIDPEGKMTIKKDWKHKPHEIIADDTVEQKKVK